MRALSAGFVLALLATVMHPSWCETMRIAHTRALIKDVKIATKAASTAPKTDFSKLNRPGPVSSPDPYFTLKLGDAEIYRDAKDHSLAYYGPVVRLGKRTGTPLAEGVGELAAELDAFRFRYYKFESGGMPKWADMQVVVVVERPEDATLESVQERWPEITRLAPVPLKLDTSAGVRMTIPYPPRSVEFSQLEGTGGTADRKWYCFSTNTHPVPADLMTDEDNDALNEQKVRDFVALITSDLTDMPSFQPMLEVRATYAGWQGASPVVRTLAPALIAKPVHLAPAVPAKPKAKSTTRTRPRTLRLPMMQFAGGPALVAAAPTLRTEVRTVPSRRTVTPAKTTPLKASTPALNPALIRPDLVRVIGVLRPRSDIDYTYSKTREMVTRLPVTYPKAQTPNYDYYFLSDSGRFGGPYFEPSAQPNRPQRAQPPEGFDGLWYESHWLGRRLVWPAPRALRLGWSIERGIRPSCRFSLSSGEAGSLTAHISYDLHPDLSTREISAAVQQLAARTGEDIELLPFTDLVDANQIALQSGSQDVQDLMAAGNLSIAKLSPQDPFGPWFRVDVEIPIDDWATFTLFMKLGEVGLWDFGVLTGASSGMAEKVAVELNADLLQALGGPVLATMQSYDPDTGGCDVSIENYGIEPLSIRGIRIVLRGEERASTDIWFDGAEVNLPGLGSASSFDQSEGAGGSVAAVVAIPESAEVKTLMDSGDYQDISVALTYDMIGPSTAPEDAGGTDPEILFSFLRSLCYQYIGSSDIIEVPIAPAEASQWFGYRSGRVVLRFQGFVYTHEVDFSGPNRVAMRRLPREGAYASMGRPGDSDVLEYRALFVTDDGRTVYLPPQPPDESVWLTADITGVNLDMTQAQ